MEHEQIERINELARLKKERPLTPEEEAERHELHQAYITGFRENMDQVLKSIRIKDEDGALTPLQKKADKP